MACTKCLNIEIPSCLSRLAISGLEAATEYVVSFIDKFNITHNVTSTTDGEGVLTVYLEDVPAQGEDPAIEADVIPALFNPYAGQFILSISKEDVAVPFVKDGITYDCARVAVIETIPSPDEFTIYVNV